MEHGAVDNNSSRVTRPPPVPPQTTLGGRVREFACDSQLQQLKEKAKGQHLQLLEGDARNHVVKKRTTTAAPS
jgi:hypothetical protein